MTQINDKEANLVSMKSLQEGEEFQKDINNIIQIIDGVEKNMCQNKLSTQFNKNKSMSFQRRKLEMTRTILAQTSHQQNQMLKQSMNTRITNDEIHKKKADTVNHSLLNFANKSNLIQSQRLSQNFKNTGQNSRQSHLERQLHGQRLERKRPMTTRKDMIIRQGRNNPNMQTTSGAYIIKSKKSKGRNESNESDALTTEMVTSAVTGPRDMGLTSNNFHKT